MDSSMCTGQSSVANSDLRHLPDDLLFGFDVEDDDREYLAKLAMRGMGPEHEIKRLISASLRRGIEEWEQALSCATAMRDQRFCHNSLDGQDILAFLAKIYGVGEPPRLIGAPSPRQRPRHPPIKRKSRKACTQDAEIPSELPAKKQIQTKKSNNSPYWNDTPVQGLTRNQQEAKGMIKKVPMKGKGASGGPITPTSTLPMQKLEEDTVTQALEGSQLTPVSLHDQLESSTPTSPIDIQEDTGYLGDDSSVGTSGETSSASSESGASTLLGSSELESNTEFGETSNRIENSEPNQASDDETKPPATQTQTPKRKAKSPYFTTAKAKATAPSPAAKSPQKRPPAGTVSSLPFPRLDSEHFGLIQEELATEPFWLLVAVTFLIRTTGKAAIPVFRALKARYPTPTALVEADTTDIVAMIRHLGLGIVRAATIQRYAGIWLEDPPRAGVRKSEDANPEGEEEEEEDLLRNDVALSAWEIGHMTQGPYALDSWRIFCRDVLRGMATDWRGGGREGEFQPEWMRVLPQDKELRACLRWMWMREGWLWDPETGEKTVLPEELRRAVQDGRVGYDDDGSLRVLD
ncbi:DNA glycosylase [Nemania sp. FL0031]|nr:DNA glycosylase [Nemania sp. FL0031]